MAEPVKCPKCGKVGYTTAPEQAKCPYCGHSPGGNPGPKPLTKKEARPKTAERVAKARNL